MKKTINGNFTIEYSINLSRFVGCSYSVVRIYSYDQLILLRHYTDDKNGEWHRVKELDYVNNRYYSQSTEHHKGIARAIDRYYLRNNGQSELMGDVFKNARSLKALKQFFGYIPKSKI